MTIKSKIKLIILFGFSFATVSCSIPGLDTQSGYIKFDIKFPDKGTFSIKAIPVATSDISIKITGEGIPDSEPVTRTISRAEANDKVTIEQLPLGTKKVEVKALNSNKQALAQATAETTIEAGKVSKLTMELKELLNKLKLVLTNYPSGGQVALAEITPLDGKPIYKQFSEREIELDNISPGKAQVKVSVLQDDATPLAIANTSVEVGKEETANINLELITLPDLSDLEINTGIPTLLKDTLSKALLKFADNNPPELNNVTVNVKGSAKSSSFNTLKPLCVNPGDQINISVDATDKDNDQINYFWGITSPFEKGNRMRLQPERGSTFSRSVDFGIGPHSIGFIMTDKKSIVGPLTLYVTVRILPCD